MPDNPFETQRPARNKMMTFRMTEAEHAQAKKMADQRGVGMVDVIREALSLLWEKDQKHRK